MVKARVDLIGGPKDGDVITIVFTDKLPKEVAVDREQVYYLDRVIRLGKDTYAKYRWRYNEAH